MRGPTSLLGLVLGACGSGAAAVDVPLPPDLSGHDQEVRALVAELHGRLEAAPGAEAWRAYAAALDANELDASALEAWARLTELEPSNTRAWYHLGCVRERGGDSEGALAALQHVLAGADDYAPAWVRAGRIHLEAGRLEEAEPALRRALELDPDALSAWLALGRLHLLRNEPEEAVRVLLPQSERNPGEPYVNGLLSRAFAMMGEWDRAQRYLAAEEFAGSPGARDPWRAEINQYAVGLKVRIERSQARLAAGDVQGAWTELEGLDPRGEDPLVLGARFQVLHAAGRAEEALALLERSSELVEQHTFLVVDRVLALRALGREADALAELEAEIARNPGHPNARALHGEILFAAGRFADAAAAFAAARERGERSLSTWIQLARSLGAIGDLEAGVRELEAAAGAYPRAPKPWAYRSEMLALEGDHTGARASLEEARARGLEPELVGAVAARLEELQGVDE